MKSLLLSLTILTLCHSAFASSHNTSASDVLVQMFELRTYNGKSVQGNSCSVTLSHINENDVLVTAQEGPLVLEKLIRDGSNYRWEPRRYFLSSDVTYSQDRMTKFEDTFMTRAITGMTQYMVVEKFKVRNGKITKTNIECEVFL